MLVVEVGTEGFNEWFANVVKGGAGPGDVGEITADGTTVLAFVVVVVVGACGVGSVPGGPLLCHLENAKVFFA